jgi:2-oxo-4-hydroxy-4-carboxy--5-ureidoimidazoline (OHCU) decarboxylase
MMINYTPGFVRYLKNLYESSRFSSEKHKENVRLKYLQGVSETTRKKLKIASLEHQLEYFFKK